MSIDQKQQRQLQDQQKDLRSQLEAQISSAEQYEEGSELSNDKAARMQMHTGNEAIQDLIDKLNNIESTLNAMNGEMDEVIEEQDQELEMEHGTSLKGGSDDGSGGGDDNNPWEHNFFYGGDDDPILIQTKRVQKRRRTHFIDSTEKSTEDKPKQQHSNLLLDILASPPQGERRGDSRYKTVELALHNLAELIGHSLAPEDLQYRSEVDDPIRLPTEIGNFMEEHAENELAASWGEILGAPDPSLLSPQGGFSTAVARMATLAICAEVANGEADEVDNAVALSLHYTAWETCTIIAKQLANQSQLHAPKIVAAVLGEDLPDVLDRELPKPNVLGGAALQKILPPPMPFLPPDFAYPQEEKIEEDPLLASLDMALLEFSGINPFLPPKSPVVDYDFLRPALQSANQLINALGRAQVEYATSAIVVHKVQPLAPILPILEHCDETLRKIARQTVQAGRALEDLDGENIFDVQTELEQHRKKIYEAHDAVQALRKWALITFAAASQEYHD